MTTAQQIVRHLHLLPHPEGGFYRETYRSAAGLTTTEGLNRSVSTAIYYLLEDDAKSHFHRIQSDELWFFHQGQPLEILVLVHGQLTTITLGLDLLAGQQPQAVIPAGCWFGARVQDSQGFALVSCTVAPGFDFADFELARREPLTREFPNQAALIEQFTRS